jgi:hypothetical protein
MEFVFIEAAIFEAAIFEATQSPKPALSEYSGQESLKIVREEFS